jgi:ABC-type nitrate/sulfonate/bicarbonate transport system substrate-binding protein
MQGPSKSNLAAIAAIIAALFASMFSLSGCGSRSNVDEPLVLVAPLTAWAWPMYIAKYGGYYEKYGLDIDLQFANHPAGIAMLTSGEAEINLVPLQRAMELAPLDNSFIAIGSPFRKWLFALVAAEGISNVSQLRGEKIGFERPGDATYVYALELLRRAGLDIDDVELVSVGSEGRIPALLSGAVEATMLSAPGYFALEDAGFKSIANITDYDDIYTPNVLLLKKTIAETHPTLLQGMIKAHAEAVRRFYEDREFALQAHLKYDMAEPVGLQRVYDKYAAERALEPVPYIAADDVRYVIDHTTDTRVQQRMKAFDYHHLIDNSVVEHVERSGFFHEIFRESLQDTTRVRAPFR